mmetsp:Transcript_25005/g.69754  ORF Transcript_25005/g.69754 Transcript_25005/m.69754 type:complete len:329 (+) Transcript_25005:541-1527(+)
MEGHQTGQCWRVPIACTANKQSEKGRRAAGAAPRGTKRLSPRRGLTHAEHGPPEGGNPLLRPRPPLLALHHIWHQRYCQRQSQSQKGHAGQLVGPLEALAAGRDDGRRAKQQQADSAQKEPNEYEEPIACHVVRQPPGERCHAAVDCRAESKNQPRPKSTHFQGALQLGGQDGPEEAVAHRHEDCAQAVDSKGQRSQHAGLACQGCLCGHPFVIGCHLRAVGFGETLLPITRVGADGEYDQPCVESSHNQKRQPIVSNLIEQASHNWADHEANASGCLNQAHDGAHVPREHHSCPGDHGSLDCRGAHALQHPDPAGHLHALRPREGYG